MVVDHPVVEVGVAHLVAAPKRTLPQSDTGTVGADIPIVPDNRIETMNTTHTTTKEVV